MGSGSPPGSANPPPWSMGSRRRFLNPCRTTARSRLRELDQAGQAAGHRGLRKGRLRLLRELPKREGRVPQAEQCRVLQRRGERLEGAVCEQRACGFELQSCGAALADEVRVVGVREPVGVRPQPGDERTLLSARTVSAAPDTEVRLDRIPALRVRGGVGFTVDHSHAHAGADATLRTNAAPAWSGVRTSRCGDRGPLNEPAPRNAPRR